MTETGDAQVVGVPPAGLGAIVMTGLGLGASISYDGDRSR